MFTYRFNTMEAAKKEFEQWTNPLNQRNWEAVLIVQNTEVGKEYVVLVDKR